MKILILGWLYLLVQVYSLAIKYETNENKTASRQVRSITDHRDGERSRYQIWPRADRSYCAPPVIGNKRTRRDIDLKLYSKQTHSLNPAYLWRRMTLPVFDRPEAISDFLQNELTVLKAVSPGSLLIKPAIPGEDIPDFGTAYFQAFGDEQFSYGIDGLCGCTSLVVIGANGVYVTHWWEYVSFNDQEEEIRGLLEEVGVSTHEELFRATVIDALRNGFERRGRLEHEPLAGAASENFASAKDDIMVYLIRPEPTDWREEYRWRWDEIKSTVTDILGLGDTDRDWWHEREYQAADGLDKIKNSGRGKALFKFDPRHRNRNSSKDVKKSILWSEHRPPKALYDREWE